MAECYRCEKELSTDNPPEHIIHNSLGGRLKCKKLLCVVCNGFYGRTIDLEIRNNSILPTLLNIELDRGNPKNSIKGIKEGSKTEYEISVDRKSKLLSRKPDLNEEGKKVYFVNNEKHAKKIAQRIHKGKDKETIEKKVNEVIWSPPEDGVIKFESNLIKTEKAIKAIAKIAINYFIYSGGSRNWIGEIIKFIELNSQIENKFVTHFHKSVNCLFDIDENEISHALYLKGSSDIGVLFCYVELFNSHCFLVVLMQPYYGEEIESKYFYDVRTKEQKDKEIKFIITNKEILNLTFSNFFNQDSADLFNKKFKRVMELNGEEVKTYKTEKN